MNHPKTIFRIALIAGVLVVALALGGAALAASTSGQISGTVTSPGGYPLPAGTLVKLFGPWGETVRGIAAPDLGNGTFNLGPVPNGLYVLKAVPPEGSGYTQSEPVAVSVVNANVDVGEIALTTPQIVGTVTAPDGLTPTPADVFVHLGDGRILQHVDADTGAYAIGGLPVGGYWLEAYPASDDPYWKSDRVDVSISDPLITQTITLTLRAADLWGVVQDSEGVPVAWATVIAAGNTGVYRIDFSSASGYWAIGDLDPGEYLLTARPPWPDSGLLPPDPITVTIPGATNPYTLTFNVPPKVVTGTVTTNTSVNVDHAQIVARRVNRMGFAETFTDASGQYQLKLTSGLWALTVKPVTDTVPSDWVYPQPPQFVYFHHTNEPESRTQDFTVIIADATVSGTVEMPGGGPPTFTVTVGLHADEGVGRRVDVNPDGTFQLTVPNGGYKVTVFPHDEGYLGPAVDPINVPVNGAYDLGTLTLLARDAAITGTVTAEGGGGVEGIPVIAWRPRVYGSLRTLTGPDGLYILAVSEGDWHVQPAPAADQAYLYIGAGADVTLAAGGVAPNVDFTLLPADATLNGVLVNEAGHPVNDAEGWAAARDVISPTIHNGAPIENGVFSILVPGGTYHVAAILPAGSRYTSAAERQVTVAAGETTTITLTVQVKDSVIAGTLWDPRNSDVVEGVAGLVGAWNQSNWEATPINTGNGSYWMAVSDGLWHLNYVIDPQAGYAKIGGPKNIPVQSHQTVIVPLPIVPKDAAISGTVLDPSGAPLPGATVLAKGIGDVVADLWLHTFSDENGGFTLAVPYGRYHLGAAIGNPAWINPIEVEVSVGPGETSSGHVLQFQVPDATISGTLIVSDTTTAGEVFVWAWSDGGGFTRGIFTTTLSGSQATGPYALDVISNTTWHLGAAFETETSYWLGQVEVTLGSGGATQDITLTGPYPKPAPVVVTFDAANPQSVTLADGTSIYIPGGAMPVTGMVTLRIVPIAGIPRQHHATILRYGYAFLATDETGQPIEDHFNQNVVITFGYTDEQLAQWHIYEPWLKPAYYSTTTERWEFPESFVVDMAANQVAMQIDHFTDFALTGSVGYAVYLPAVAR